MARKSILKKSETKYMARIPQAEILDAMQQLSSGAYKLLMYYYSRRDGWEFVDSNIASAIGTSVRQFKKFRKELLDKRYLLIQKGSIDVYFIGKLAVAKFLHPGEMTDNELMEYLTETQAPLISSPTTSA